MRKTFKDSESGRTVTLDIPDGVELTQDEIKSAFEESRQQNNVLAKNESWARPLATTVGAIGGGLLGGISASPTGPLAIPASIAGAGTGEALVGRGYDFLADKTQSGKEMAIQGGKDAFSGMIGASMGPVLKGVSKLIPEALGKKLFTNLGSKYFKPENINKTGREATNAIIEGGGAGVTKAEQQALQRYPSVSDKFSTDFEKYKADWNKLYKSSRRNELKPKLSSSEYLDEWKKSNPRGDFVIDMMRGASKKAIDAKRTLNAPLDLKGEGVLGSIGGLMSVANSVPSVNEYTKDIFGYEPVATALTIAGMGLGARKGSIKYAKQIAKGANSLNKQLSKLPKGGSISQALLGVLDYGQE